jgi:hypothetical protein
MSNQSQPQDPMEFLKGVWSSMGFPLPGVVTPTLDVNEIDKRITEFRAVESWLKMNLNMLQMSIQGLEMQRTTLAAMHALSRSATEGGEAGVNPFASAALWPWQLIQQATSSAVSAATAATAATAPPPAETSTNPAAPKK